MQSVYLKELKTMMTNSEKGAWGGQRYCTKTVQSTSKREDKNGELSPFVTGGVANFKNNT